MQLHQNNLEIEHAGKKLRDMRKITHNEGENYLGKVSCEHWVSIVISNA